MSSRALSLATVLLLIGFGATDTVLAQATNLEAGKTPSQIFAQTCNACHKSPRGLLKSVAPGSLPGFLRQHYTTSSDMAGILASYLVSNGATDARFQAKDGKDKKDGARDKEANTAPGQAGEHQGRRPRAQDAARPEGEAAAPAPEGARQKRAARPAEDGSKPEGQAAPEGRKGKRRGKPAAGETPKLDAAAPATEEKSEPKPETKPETRPDAAKVEPSRDEAKPDSSKASEKPVEIKPDSAKVESRGSETPALRPDPVPAVTPAAPAAKPAEPKPAEEAAPKPAAPAASSEPAAKPQEPAPPATAAAPPAESSGPPAPPISR
ncbi:hypothetical protein [Bradyrhizobium sp. UNPA324]|uniref:hypothetical protein n=1 Tax=Bradyrhizobium sp. UNPA324 TaxID=1141174 RepID=UPI0011709C6D|nr:hypothetical protein [Bradyrhizobium sp. UNPA324]TQF34320.1 hypothetical protein UNPA324_15670 [Bradyrhizobium sp. UNPA324]